jgi:hypothetical protein
MPFESASRLSRRIGLALAGGEGTQKILERPVALVEPVELLVVAQQEAGVAEGSGVSVRQEGGMNG